MEKIALIDVDGVLADFVSAMADYAFEKFGKIVDPAIFEDSLNQEELEEILMNPDIYASLEMMEGAKEGVDRIRELGYKIYIVTARTLPKIVTIQWLLDHDIYFDYFYCEDPKGRLRLAKEVNASVIVDDMFTTCIEAAKICRTFMVKNEWNDFYNPDIIEVNNIMDVADYLEDLNEDEVGTG